MKKIAYLILAHDDVKMLTRLVDALDYNADFYIHIDKKSHLDIKKITKMKNVNLVARKNVFWGGYSMIEATMLLIKEVVLSKKKYSKVILLSGHDYPIRPVKEIYNFFINNKSNFISGFNVSKVDINNIKKEVTVPHFYDIKLFKKNTLPFKIIRRLMNVLTGWIRLESQIQFSTKKIDIYKGSQWWALNQNVINYFYDFVTGDRDSVRYIRRMKRIFVPDEKFFQTLFFNSAFKNMNQTKGPKKFPAEMYYKYPEGSVIRTTAYMSKMNNVHIIYPDLKKTYDISDLDEILECMKKNNNIMFIRKVDSVKSANLLNYLDKKMGVQNDSCNN